ncbi:hypothetical protein CDAR_573311 [Caerostris darwini]|uniref:Uncharacterized protein n=1 Tax=Caerostris darwini TaxID=1538125 RepID=A0AAV4VP96_9ARAC|nr:hypothetical protein CDAR_573311 [Caerostris darwini]
MGREQAAKYRWRSDRTLFYFRFKLATIAFKKRAHVREGANRAELRRSRPCLLDDYWSVFTNTRHFSLRRERRKPAEDSTPQSLLAQIAWVVVEFLLVLFFADMSFSRCKGSDRGRKRSQSLPATNSVLKNNGISGFFSRRNSSDDSVVSRSASKEKKRRDSLMESMEEEEELPNYLTEILPIPFEKPKPKYRTDFPRPEFFPEETWKERLVRILQEGARRIVSFFQD